MPESKRKLVFLGVGQVARALADLSGDAFELHGTTRSAERVEEIRKCGIEPLVIENFQRQSSANLVSLLDGAYVVVSFPPDEVSDLEASRLAASAAGIVYVSSTAVYGKSEGVVDENTPVDEETPQSVSRLQAERKWLAVGASVIRAPGIYGRGSGLHHRLIGGQYRLPGDGSNFVSRIHLDDLSAMILSALTANEKQQILLSGDSKPTTHKEIVAWLVKRLNLPFPESIALDQCHYTQRGNRKVDASKSLARLQVLLKYPTFVEGYENELAQLPIS